MPQINDEKIRIVKDLLLQLMKNEDWQKALVIGEYLVTLNPEEILAYRAMGFSSLELHDLDRSEEFFLKALEYGDANPETLLLISRIHYYRGDLNGEISWLKKALEQDPDNPVAAFSLALTYITLGEHESAEALLNSIIASHPDHVPSRRALADIYLSAQKLDEAEEQLREAVKLQGNNSQLFSDIGYILKRKNNFSDALAMYFHALELNPNNVTRYYDIGDTFMALGETERAISYLRKADQIDPYNSLVCYNLGRAYFDLGRYKQCEAASKAALQYDPEMVNGRTNLGLNATINLGLAYLNLGKLDGAERCFRKNLQLTASSYFNLGLALHRQQKYEEALKNFLHAVELVPIDAEYWDLVGNTYLELNQLDDAQKVLEKAIEIDPTYPPAHYDLGLVFSRRKGQENEAMKLFKHAITLNPDGPLPYYAISCLYSLQNKKKSALNFLQKAIQRGFNDREYLDNDHDFDTLRDDEEFQKIIRKMIPR
jgi:tetratricopeptide (TPR) repeat protein